VEALAHLVQRLPALRRQLFDFRVHFCHSAPMETQAFGFTVRANAPDGQKRFPIISWGRCRNLS
jgi:hypothetical protein